MDKEADRLTGLEGFVLRLPRWLDFGANVALFQFWRILSAKKA